MKTLKFLSFAAIVALMSTGMGFPTDLTEKGKNAAKKTSRCQTEAKVTMVYDHSNEPAKVASRVAEDEPVVEFIAPVFMLAASENITLKVFDLKGQVVVCKEVSMGEFLSRSKSSQLPDGSTFVMFHNQTAYYFLEEASI